MHTGVTVTTDPFQLLLEVKYQNFARVGADANESIRRDDRGGTVGCRTENRLCLVRTRVEDNLSHLAKESPTEALAVRDRLGLGSPT